MSREDSPGVRVPLAFDISHPRSRRDEFSPSTAIKKEALVLTQSKDARCSAKRLSQF